MGGLQSLTLLHLAHNRLESLPPEAGFWSSLTELNIATNQVFFFFIAFGLELSDTKVYEP